MSKKVQLIADESVGYFVQDAKGLVSIQIFPEGQPMLVLDRFPILRAHKFCLYIDEGDDVRIQLVKGKEWKDFSLFDMVTKLEELGMPLKKEILT